jgi:hypothetical protein
VRARLCGQWLGGVGRANSYGQKLLLEIKTKP